MDWRRELGPRLGSFALEGELGRGSFGVVLRARRDGVPVALKVMPTSGADPEDLARFEQEARVAHRLDHPGIVRVIEAGHERGFAYFAMELCEGKTLADELARSRLSAFDAAQLVARLARAIHYAHEQNVVHRDLKPQNVILAGDRPRLVDFGLARDLTRRWSLTRSGAVMGTPGYMSPEQVLGKKVDQRADVYALGVILYHCLLGDLPHHGGDFASLGRQIVEAPPPAPRSLDPTLPRALEHACLRALAKDPADRFQDAGQLAAELEEWLTTAEAATPGARQVRAPALAQTARRDDIAWRTEQLPSSPLATPALESPALGRPVPESDSDRRPGGRAAALRTAWRARLPLVFAVAAPLVFLLSFGLSLAMMGGEPQPARGQPASTPSPTAFASASPSASASPAPSSGRDEDRAVATLEEARAAARKRSPTARVLQLLDEAAALAPEGSKTADQVEVERGWLRYRRADYPQALELARALQARSATATDGLHLEARVLIVEDRFPAARPLLERAQAQAPRAILAAELTVLELLERPPRDGPGLLEVLRRLEQQLAQARDEGAEWLALHLRAFAYFGVGLRGELSAPRLEEAVVMARAAAERSGDDVHPNQILALLEWRLYALAMRRQDRDAARRALEAKVEATGLMSACASRPHEVALLWRAHTLYLLGRLREAEEDLTTLVRAFPESIEGEVWRAGILHLSGREAEARAAWRALYARDPAGLKELLSGRTQRVDVAPLRPLVEAALR
ncbi:MAG: protein kinase [Planctomycetota bacterium]